MLFTPSAGVAGDAGAFIGVDLVLIDDPFEGGAVAERVVEDFGWDACEGDGVVDDEGVADTPRIEMRLPRSFDPRFLRPLEVRGLQRPLRPLLELLNLEFGLGENVAALFDQGHAFFVFGDGLLQPDRTPLDLLGDRFELSERFLER